MGMYNYTDSIRDFARACFSYGLRRRFPVYLSTKNTVLMASVLITPDGGIQLTEAAHGTIARHHRRRQAGEATSTNPIATIYAWTRALAHRASLHGNAALAGFAADLERATTETVERGIMADDLAGLFTPAARGVSTEDFIDAVAAAVAGPLR